MEMSDDTLKVGDRIQFSTSLLRDIVIRELLLELYPFPQTEAVEVVEIRRRNEYVELVLRRAEISY